MLFGLDKRINASINIRGNIASVHEAALDRPAWCVRFATFATLHLAPLPPPRWKKGRVVSPRAQWSPQLKENGLSKDDDDDAGKCALQNGAVINVVYCFLPIEYSCLETSGAFWGERERR